MNRDSLKVVLRKIQESTVTIEDFNKLISETTPESIKARIDRRTQRNATKSHIDNKTGHQSLGVPDIVKRVTPKRKPVNQQNHGRSKQGNKHSQRTQAAKRYMQEALFIKSNIGKPIDESTLIKINIPDLVSLASKMLKIPNIDRDWLYKLLSQIKGKNERLG